MTQFRLIGALDAIAIELTRRNTSHPNMPDVTGPMTHRIQINAPGRTRVVRILIEFQVNTGRVAAEQDKLDSVTGLVRAPDGQRISRQNLTLHESQLESVRFILFSGRFTHRAPMQTLMAPACCASTLHVKPCNKSGQCAIGLWYRQYLCSMDSISRFQLNFSGRRFFEVSLKRSENDSFERTSPETMVRSSMFVVEAR